MNNSPSSVIQKSEALERFACVPRLSKMKEIVVYLELNSEIKFIWDYKSYALPLISYIVDLFNGTTMYMIIDEIGIWPSFENRDLIEYLSECYTGDKKSIYEKCLVFDSNERGLRLSFVQLAMQFGWGGVLFSSHERWFRFDHDSYGFLRAGENLRGEIGKFAAVKNIY